MYCVCTNFSRLAVLRRETNFYRQYENAISHQITMLIVNTEIMSVEQTRYSADRCCSNAFAQLISENQTRYSWKKSLRRSILNKRLYKSIWELYIDRLHLVGLFQQSWRRLARSYSFHCKGQAIHVFENTLYQILRALYISLITSVSTLFIDENTRWSLLCATIIRFSWLKYDI